MKTPYMRERQKRAFLDQYQKKISRLTKPELSAEWDRVRQELNSNCRLAANGNT